MLLHSYEYSIFYLNNFDCTMYLKNDMADLKLMEIFLKKD